jgi:hypothetical protein
MKFIFPFINYNDVTYFSNCNKTFLQKIKKINNTKIIYFHPEEHSKVIEERNFFKKIEKTLKKNNSTMELWLGNYHRTDPRTAFVRKNRITIVNWKEYLMFLSYSRYIKYHNKSKYLPIDRLFTCLNHRQRYHRSVLMSKIFQEDLNNDGYISFLRFGTESKRFNEIFNKEIVMDIYDPMWVIKEDYYHKSLINVITETTTDVPDISEKTWYSILHNRPFMILGYKGIHKQLQEMGFLLYDSLIDYSFDNLSNVDDRVNGIIENLKRLKKLNYQEEFDKLIPIIEYNRSVFLKYMTSDNVPDKFFDYYKNYDSLEMQYYSQILKDCGIN